MKAQSKHPDQSQFLTNRQRIRNRAPRDLYSIELKQALHSLWNDLHSQLSQNGFLMESERLAPDRPEESITDAEKKIPMKF